MNPGEHVLAGPDIAADQRDVRLAAATTAQATWGTSLGSLTLDTERLTVAYSSQGGIEIEQVANSCAQIHPASQHAPIEEIPSVGVRALASKLMMEAGLSPGIAEPVGVGVVVAIITYASLIIGELVPKQIALRDPGLAPELEFAGVNPAQRERIVQRQRVTGHAPRADVRAARQTAPAARGRLRRIPAARQAAA